MRTCDALLCLLGSTVLGACRPAEMEEHHWGNTGAHAEATLTIEVPPPPFSEGVFPCSECHDPEVPTNTRRRELKMAHTDIQLHHDEEHRWCLDCHDEKDRDKLHLASGALIDFTESYKLCGQCHGDKYRDWRAGVHGRRSGMWDGHKTYLLCVNCHNAHSPAFKPLQPKPAPIPPHGGSL